MKWIVVSICIAASTAIVSATLCHRQEDCDGYATPRCCVALLIASIPLTGLCLPMNREGAKCSPPEAKCDYFGKYILSCPCQEGMECKPRGLSPSITDPGRIFHSMRCQKAATTTEPPTTTVAETEINTEGRPEVTTRKEEIVEPEITTREEEVVEPEITTREEEVVEPEVTTIEEVEEVTTEARPEDEETGGNEVGEETGGNETGPEDNVNEVVEEEPNEGETGEVLEETPDEIPEEVGQGPGGEPPRDDDCEDWELPC